MSFFSKKNKRPDLPKLDKENWRLIRRVWKKYIAPKWGWLAFAVVFMLIASGFDALLVRMLQPVFDEVFIDKNKMALGIIGMQILALYFVKGLAGYLQVLIMTKVGLNVIADMQNDAFKHIIRMDDAYFKKETTGDLISHFTADVLLIKDAMLNGLTTLVKDSSEVVFLIVLMFFKSFEMAAVMFVVFPIGMIPVVFCGRRIRKVTKKQQEVYGLLFNVLSQAFQGIKIVKSYCMESAEERHTDESVRKLNKLSMSMTKISALQSPLMEFFGGIAMAGTLGFGGYKIMQGAMSPGDFVVFLLAIVAAYKPMKNVANLHMRLQIGVAAMQRLYGVLDKKPTIVSAPDATELSVTQGRLSFENVTFSYDGEHDVLKNVSLTVEPHATVAVVGHSGSGKSTLINLVPRFYDANAGRVEIDGQDITRVTLQSLRKQVAYVSQEVVLFDATVADNIRYGTPDATDEQGRAAATAAAADGFIENLEHGYDTMVGERGGLLSGGQRQMISIARAMLKNAPVLLLDEATSALDSKSERVVQDSLDRLMKNRTTVVIAHRLSTIVNADKIVVMNDGQIVDVGTHEELLSREGIYATLYKIQFMKGE